MGPWMKEATSTHHFNQVSTKSSKAWYASKPKIPYRSLLRRTTIFTGRLESYLCGSMHGRTGEAGGMSTFETVRELCKVEMAKHGLVLDLSKDNYNTESLWRKETIYRRSSWSSRIDAR
jgi:hypothetical protein